SQYGKEILPLLYEAFLNGDGGTRFDAGAALMRLGKAGELGETDVEALLLALRRNDEDTQWAAIIALGYIKSERAIEPLIKSVEPRLLSNDDPTPWFEPEPEAEPFGYAWITLDCIGRIGGERAKDYLISVFNRGNLLSAVAIGALGYIPGDD